jgi:pyruvate/2-oxoglutarate dehydrogenase complex dihydrolipoamide dehydrogenase (E3) component
VDFGEVMRRMRSLRARISHHDSARRFRDELGVDVFLGSARFTAPDTVEVGGRRLRFSKAVIATGARAAEPPIPGLAEAGYLTNETVFNLTERPRRLAVIGGGPIGCELAQAFRRLGSEVALLNDTDHVLNREDADAAAIVQRAFVREGVELVLGCRIERVESAASGKIIHFTQSGGARQLTVDAILVGAGRAPNVDGLGLEAAGERYHAARGVEVDDNLRTANPRIFAAGDICMDHKFTHAADAAARIVIQNALFPGPKRKLSGLVMPWCTYTDPEIAHVGLYERDATAKGIEIATFVRELKDVDRAVADGEEEGFVKVHVKKGSDKIVGATIVARHAGEMIGEIAVAIAGGVGLGALASVIHPYPTQAEAIRQCGDAYRRTLLSPVVKRVFGAWLRWSR